MALRGPSPHLGRAPGRDRSPRGRRGAAAERRKYGPSRAHGRGLLELDLVGPPRLLQQLLAAGSWAGTPDELTAPPSPDPQDLDNFLPTGSSHRRQEVYLAGKVSSTHLGCVRAPAEDGGERCLTGSVTVRTPTERARGSSDSAASGARHHGLEEDGKRPCARARRRFRRSLRRRAGRLSRGGRQGGLSGASTTRSWRCSATPSRSCSASGLEYVVERGWRAVLPREDGGPPAAGPVGGATFQRWPAACCRCWSRTGCCTTPRAPPSGLRIAISDLTSRKRTRRRAARQRGALPADRGEVAGRHRRPQRRRPGVR